MKRALQLIILVMTLSLCAVFLTPPTISTGQSAPATRAVDFNREIRPILADNCFACHGPDDNQRKARLRFDT
ncbi:MAG: hypothetical protein ACKV2V_15540, partial [Blastocatellia bacterium]